MEFIQLISEPRDGISRGDSYCFGRKVHIHAYSPPHHIERDDLYKFRDHMGSKQNGNTGWYCHRGNLTSFRLNLYF